MSWKTCPICYAVFRNNGCVKYCLDCRKNRQDEIEAYRKEQKAMRELRKRTGEDHYEFIEEMMEYNKTHGTKLSYGQYVALKDGRGKLVRSCV